MNETEKPLVTFALFAYNQEKFIRDAVEGALAQDYENLEIILSDDCSTDRTFEIMSEMISNYKGGHAVLLNRNVENCGLTAHFNKILKVARGGIIVVAAGDDISLPNRSTLVVQVLKDNPYIMAVSFDDHVIDDSGRVIRFNKCDEEASNSIISGHEFFQGKSKALSGASRGFRKELYEKFGDLNENCPTEDTPYLVRTFLVGTACACPLPGIYYRRHGNNLSGEANLHKINFQAIFDQYRKDIDFARDSNFATSKIIEMANFWAFRNLRRRVIRGKVYNRSISFIEYLKYVLISEDYTFREKIGILKKVWFST
ncbi:MAG: glycosyltransferase [Pseudomonadota bacterium]